MAIAEKTRNNSKWTEAAYFGKIRAVLRRGFQHWGPAIQAKLNARKRIHDPENPRQRWTYNCEICDGWFKGTEVQIDHRHPVGSLRSLDELPVWVERLTREGSENYACLCKSCHQVKTQMERKIRSNHTS